MRLACHPPLRIARLAKLLRGLALAAALTASVDAAAAPPTRTPSAKASSAKPGTAKPGTATASDPAKSAARPAPPPRKAIASPTRKRGAAPPPPATRAPASPPRDLRVALEVVRERLAGGIEVVVVPQPASPVVSIAVVEGAGSAADPAGRGGLMSLWSHMGGPGASPERRARLVAERGGTAELQVGRDDVIASYVLPAGDLELALWLEADRLAARPDENTLMEALRSLAEQRATDPFARHAERLDALAFQGFAPYAHPPDGSAEELIAIRADALAGRLAARPARPIAVVIAGPVDPKAAIAAARRHLDALPAGPPPPPLGEAPDQINQRAASLVDGRTRTAILLLGFAIPRAALAADGPALELAAVVLAGGPRSRLGRLLVDEGSASEVDASLERRRGPAMLRVEVRIAAGADAVTVRDRVERALVDLGKDTPREAELDRARTWLALDEARELAQGSALAVRLGRASVAGGAEPLGAWDLGRWREVKGDDVARVAAGHLSPIRRNVVEVMPARPLEAPPVASPRPVRSGAPVSAPPRPAGSSPKGLPSANPPAKHPANTPARPARPAKKRGGS